MTDKSAPSPSVSISIPPPPFTKAAPKKEGIGPISAVGIVVNVGFARLVTFRLDHRTGAEWCFVNKYIGTGVSGWMAIALLVVFYNALWAGLVLGLAARNKEREAILERRKKGWDGNA